MFNFYMEQKSYLNFGEFEMYELISFMKNI